jgi:hypothetical protein
VLIGLLQCIKTIHISISIIYRAKWLRKKKRVNDVNINVNGDVAINGDNHDKAMTIGMFNLVRVLKL